MFNVLIKITPCKTMILYLLEMSHLQTQSLAAIAPDKLFIYMFKREYIKAVPITSP